MAKGLFFAGWSSQQAQGGCTRGIGCFVADEGLQIYGNLTVTLEMGMGGWVNGWADKV